MTDLTRSRHLNATDRDRRIAFRSASKNRKPSINLERKNARIGGYREGEAGGCYPRRRRRS